MVRNNWQQSKNFDLCMEKYPDQKCFNCGKTPSELIPPKEKHEIHHINGNDRDHNPDNLTWACHGCNHLRKYRKSNLLRKRSQFLENLSEKPFSNEMKKNKRSEPKWRDWVLHEIHQNHSLCEMVAIYGGAEVVKCNPQTTTRYEKKMLAHNILERGWGHCDNQLCDETHLYLYGQAPKMESGSERVEDD